MEHNLFPLEFQGIGYNLIEEIETEYALHVINKQKENRVIIPREIKQNAHYQQVALMIADNISNLKRTLSGSGTSPRVNSILVIKEDQLRQMMWLTRHKKDLQKESADDPYQQIFWRDKFLITMEGSAWDQEN